MGGGQFTTYPGTTARPRSNWLRAKFAGRHQGIVKSKADPKVRTCYGKRLALPLPNAAAHPAGDGSDLRGQELPRPRNKPTAVCSHCQVQLSGNALLSARFFPPRRRR